MKKYLSVLHDYEDSTFFEPGVAKKPSFELQRKAIDLLLQKRNALQIQEFNTTKHRYLSVQDFNFPTNQVSGVVFFSAESLRDKNKQINLELFSSLYKKFSEIFIIVESISIDNMRDFSSFYKRFIGLNYCAQRDASKEWRELVIEITNENTR